MGLGASYLAAVGLTLTNPATILSFFAAFGALGVATSRIGAGLMVAGVFAGSALWWLILCGLIARLRHALFPHAMLRIDQAAAAFLIGFGFGLAAVAGLL